MRRILMLAVAATLAACSSQPATPQPESAPVAAAPAPAATSESVGPALAAKPVVVANSRGKIPSGYRLEKRDGKELYCRNVTTLGSRFAQKTCFTREQLEDIVDRTESTIEDMNRGMAVCAGGGACQGN